MICLDLREQVHPIYPINSIGWTLIRKNQHNLPGFAGVSPPHEVNQSLGWTLIQKTAGKVREYKRASPPHEPTG